jgi:hypothetical protein
MNRKIFFVVYEKVRKGGDISIEGFENIDHKRGSIRKMDRKG